MSKKAKLGKIKKRKIDLYITPELTDTEIRRLGITDMGELRLEHFNRALKHFKFQERINQFKKDFKKDFERLNKRLDLEEDINDYFKWMD